MASSTKCTTVTVALLIVGVARFAVAAPSNDARSYCAAKWDTYQMQAYCVDQEEKARSHVYSRGSIEERIWNYCVNHWDSWQMVDYCVSQEEEAKRRLGR